MVAAETGYRDLSTFIRQFKRFTGINAERLQDLIQEDYVLIANLARQEKSTLLNLLTFSPVNDILG